MKETDTLPVYIVLIKALTGLGTISRKLSDYEYTHIAVSLDPKLETFMSFSRRGHFTPFDAGFTCEYRDYYAFGAHRRVQVKVFKLPVDQKHMNAIKSFIQTASTDPEYIFNLYSMVTMPLLHGFSIYKALNCMSFTAKIIALSGAVRMTKPHIRYSIADIDQLLTEFFLYEGYLKPREITSAAYMKRSSLPVEAVHFMKLNGQLLYRLIGNRRKPFEG